MRKLPARKLLLALAAGALLIPYEGFTLGLGEIEVNSALNQKLKADIELLSATPEDTESLIVKLASRKEFVRAGIDRPYQLSDLRFKSEVINGVPYIKVSSGSPIREPFLNFLVEVDWPKGHLLREYTVLLDPPVFMTQSASTTSAPVQQTPPKTAASSSDFRPGAGSTTAVTPAPEPAAAATTSRPETEAVTQAPAPAPAETVSPQSSWAPPPVQVQPQQVVVTQTPGDYRIKRGDTAWSLAAAMRPDQDITVPQMMIAMLRANPESFINGNINGLKRGSILRVPDYDQIATISRTEALATVKEQAALWQQYQQAQSGAQPVTAMASDGTSSAATADDSAGGAAENDAHLEIVSAGTGTSSLSGKDPTDMSSAELRAQLALAREKVETERVEKEALQQRVDTLEQHVDKMKGMLSIEDAELSEVQSLNLPADEAVAAEETAAVEGEGESLAETEDEISEAELTDEAVMDEAAMDETVVDAEGMAEDSDAAESAEEALTDEAAEDAEEALFTDETAVDDETAAEMQQESETAVMDESAPMQPQIVDSKPADPLSKLLNDPKMLAAAGGGVLLLIALIAMIIKRRKTATDEDDESMAGAFDDLDSLTSEVADETAAMNAAKEKKQSKEKKKAVSSDKSEPTVVLDTAEDTVVSENAPAAGENDAARDDVIAEADVYLAYGIYQQAEELLSQAIADNPGRDDYRLKLAETHYASKDAEKFITVSSALKERINNDDSPIWKKVMVMGQDLCADNPMFQGSMVGSVDDVASLSPETPEMDFDLGTDETDTGISDIALELPEEDEASAEVADELEFDLSEAEAVDETAIATDEADEFSLDIDASELDIDIQDETSAAAEDDEVSIDLDEIDIGLDETADEVAEQTATAETGELEDDFDLSSLDDVDEISTKLDLARAYLDMGDNEGTRGILEEVIAEGNDEQKQEANDLMAKLA